MDAPQILLQPYHALMATSMTVIPVTLRSAGIGALFSILDATEDDPVLYDVQKETGCLASIEYRQKMVSKLFAKCETLGEHALSRLEASSHVMAHCEMGLFCSRTLSGVYRNIQNQGARFILYEVCHIYAVHDLPDIKYYPSLKAAHSTQSSSTP